MNITNSPSFAQNYINYKKLKPKTKVFVPLDLFSPDQADEDSVFFGNVNLLSGIMELAHLPGISNILHLMEVMEPSNEIEKISPNIHQINTLQQMYNGSLTKTSRGPGSRLGVWIDAQTAYDLGLLALPKDNIALQNQFEARFMQHMQNFKTRVLENREKAKSTPIQTTNVYTQKTKNYGSMLLKK